MLPSNAALAAILADLNEPQRQAVTHRDGPLLVLAGPGSGKTRVITRRAAHLVHTGVPASSILAITFTNKAADEMKRRIETLGVARGMWVYTFHALGARLLHEFGPLAQVGPNFTIYDDGDSLKLIREIMEAQGISTTWLRPEAAAAEISRAKNQLFTPEGCRERAENAEQRQITGIYETYTQQLIERNAVDFDDLLMRVAVVLRDRPEVTERLNIRFRYVLIDEYQDTNHAQYRIARHLTEHHRNICATGDPDQSIYAWRGADIRNILEFERDFSDAVVVRLEENYRSTQRILAVADRLIQHNRQRKHKTLWTRRAAGEPVNDWRFANGEAEARAVAGEIIRLHGAGRAWNDFAVFYRINAMSRGLEEYLLQSGVPYRIVRGVEFYRRKEIRDVLAYLRVIVNPADEIALLRIINTPARGIGKTTVDRLRAAARDAGKLLGAVLPEAEQVLGTCAAAKRVATFVSLMGQLRGLGPIRVPKLVSEVLVRSGLEEELREEKESGGEDRLANVEELVTAARRYEEQAAEPSLEDFLARTSLISDQDAVDEQAGVVNLMTLHAAKGLEFPVVFLVGMEQGMLPYEHASGGLRNEEEERRLCFVGLTRAKEVLVLTHAGERLIRGRREVRSPSRFLYELDDETVATRDFRGLAARPEHQGEVGEHYVPMLDDLPPDEAAQRAPKRTWRPDQPNDWSGDRPRQQRRSSSRWPADAARKAGGPAARSGEPAPVDEATAPLPTDSPYAGWAPGMLVQHATYGVGQLLWIRPASGQTRAGVKFAGCGEKTFILEFAKLERLKRGK